MVYIPNKTRWKEYKYQQQSRTLRSRHKYILKKRVKHILDCTRGTFVKGGTYLIHFEGLETTTVLLTHIRSTLKEIFDGWD